MQLKNPKKDYVLCFGTMIRERRKALGMSAEDLAEKCNRSEREIRDIELGKSEPLFGTTLLLCQSCNVDMGELEVFVPREEISYV